MCNKDYYELNKDKYKQYYQQNKEIILKREQLYYQRNQAEIRIKQRTYFRKYYLLNKETIIENVQRRYYGSIAGMPDKIKPEEACNQIMNGNIIIRLDD
jgi:hypothetical protein